MKEVKSIYMQELDMIPLLTSEEEKLLAREVQKGNKEALNKLVNSNLRFVVKIAHQYEGYMEFEDLVAEGNLGLIHAAEKFNPDNNTRFTTYAVWWIRDYIQKAIRETSTGVRFPATRYKDMKKWKVTSLDKGLKNKDGEDVTLMDLQKDEKTPSPENQFWNGLINKELTAALQTLKDAEQAIIIKRYGLDGMDPMSLSQLGKEFGYSKERIRQIEKKSLLKMREVLEVMNMSGDDNWAA